MKYEIGVHGCDDSTIFEMDLTENEVEIIKKVAEMCNKTSTYVCMPSMNIEVVEDGNT